MVQFPPTETTKNSLLPTDCDGNPEPKSSYAVGVINQNWTIILGSSCGFVLELAWRHASQRRAHAANVAVQPDALGYACFASSQVLQIRPLTGSRSSVLRNDSATTLPYGSPGREMDYICRGPQSVFGGCAERHTPQPPWKACPSLEHSRPAARLMASMARSSIIPCDIDQPTTFLNQASMAVMRRGRPSPVGM